jgi:hypothetical protein
VSTGMGVFYSNEGNNIFIVSVVTDVFLRRSLYIVKRVRIIDIVLSQE